MGAGTARIRFSGPRVLFLAGNTLRAAVRQKVLGFLFLLAVALVLGAQYFRDFHFGSPELKFLADLGFGAIAGFGAVLTVVATAQLFFSELEHRTVLTLLAKPVRRSEFVLGKFLGVAAVSAIFCGALTLVLAGVLWARENSLMREFPGAFADGRVINYAHVGLTGLVLWLKLLVLGALTLLVASYAQTQLFTMVTGFLVYVICHLEHLAQAASARAGASALGLITGLVAHALPNFQLFSLADTLEGGESLPWVQLGRVSLYALGYVATACALAVFSFCRREI